MSELLQFWKRYNPQDGTYIHQEDAALLDEKDRGYFCYEKSVDNKTILHGDLRPEPFYGDLKRAKIYLLFLNPGFAESDYADNTNEIYRKINTQTLQQDFSGILSKYKFPWLNPEYGNKKSSNKMSAGLYWSGNLEDKRKLGVYVYNLINEGLVKKYKGRFSDDEIWLNFADNFCNIEMIPYHSTRVDNTVFDNLANKLPSSKLAKDFFQKELVKRAENDEAIVILGRRVEFWNYKGNNSNIIVHNPGQARKSSIGPATVGGKAILDFYERKTENFTKLL